MLRRLGGGLGPWLQRLIDRVGFGLVVVLGDRLWLNRSLASGLGRETGFTDRVDGWFSALYGAKSDRVRASFEENRAAGWPGTAVIPLPREAGGYLSVAFSAVRLGPFELWIMADITARAESFERCHRVIEHSTAPHVLFGEEGIMACNLAAAELLGYPSAEALAAVPPGALSPEYQPDGRPSAEKAFAMERAVFLRGRHRFEWIHRGADGTLVPVEVTLTRIDLSSGPALLAVWTDLREHEEALAAVERARDAAEAEVRGRRAFMAAMAHEIRTAMSGVLGMAGAIADEDPQIPDAIRGSVRVIRDSGWALRQLLDDLLDFSRFDAGEVGLEQAVLSLPRLVDDALRLHRATAAQRGVALSARVSPELPPGHLGDVARLRRVFHELVGNAVKFTHDGSVRVCVDPAPGGGVRVRVRDTGVGMSAEQRARALEPFSRVEGSRFGGAGLGLALVSRLVKAMDGTIELFSVPDDGTTVEVRLPLPEAEVEPASGASLEPLRADAPPLRVLVAEDDPLNQLVLRTILEAQPNLRLRFVDNGFQAVAEAERFSPDLVLMDVWMPEIDGLRATARLRAGGYTGPVVALTASYGEAERSACLDVGMDAVLPKPVESEALMRLLHEAARRHREASHSAG